MRLSNPHFLAIVFGLAGGFVGGLVGMFGYLWIDSLIHTPSGTGAEGEYAAPFGFAGAILGLLIAGWSGFRLGKRRGREG
jgi:hypothetical protein